MNTNYTVRKYIQTILPEIVALRHTLHEHPEIRYEEHWTSDKIAAFLTVEKIPHTRGHAGGTGIVVTIEGKASAGHKNKTVALRADIDALEIQELTGLPYASTIPERMHACGHDGHTANLCGVAKVLFHQRELLNGTVKLIFQPAEEQAAGGKRIVEEGLLDDVDAVFALHAWPGIPVGQFGAIPGCAMASADAFYVRISGSGGHAANPGVTVDPIPIAAQVITGFQQIVSRKLNPWDAAVITVARMNAGHATNIIPEYADIEGTFRTLTPDIRIKVIEQIQQITEGTAAAFGAKVEILFDTCGYPALHNDPEMTRFCLQIIQNHFGEDKIFPCTHPYMTAEDFAFYLQKIPGAYLFLGNDDTELEQPVPSLHSQYFDFNDAALPYGIEMMVALATDFLNDTSGYNTGDVK